eukprot:GHVU01223962.1.p1 GENE.GHVU01223962.1~~GHVU01223962.1.p1  ORF type:complete len:146 (+),score=5.01 GHVU01223962.1:1957-2394(+)
MYVYMCVCTCVRVRACVCLSPLCVCATLTRPTWFRFCPERTWESPVAPPLRCPSRTRTSGDWSVASSLARQRGEIYRLCAHNRTSTAASGQSQDNGARRRPYSRSDRQTHEDLNPIADVPIRPDLLELIEDYERYEAAAARNVCV